MKLSEAILKGCALMPVQVKRWYFDKGGCCALGAAAIGAGLVNLQDAIERDVSLNRNDLYRAFPSLNYRLCHQIEMLNDDGTSREQIAEWLAEQGL